MGTNYPWLRRTTRGYDAQELYVAKEPNYPWLRSQEAELPLAAQPKSRTMLRVDI